MTKMTTVLLCRLLLTDALHFLQLFPKKKKKSTQFPPLLNAVSVHIALGVTYYRIFYKVIYLSLYNTGLHDSMEVCELLHATQMTEHIHSN